MVTSFATRQLLCLQNVSAYTVLNVNNAQGVGEPLLQQVKFVVTRRCSVCQPVFVWNTIFLTAPCQTAGQEAMDRHHQICNFQVQTFSGLRQRSSVWVGEETRSEVLVVSSVQWGSQLSPFSRQASCLISDSSKNESKH